MDPIFAENVDRNFLMLNDEGVATTIFGNVRESYNLSDAEAEGLKILLGHAYFDKDRLIEMGVSEEGINILSKIPSGGYDVRELLGDIPGAKIIDLSVAMTRGDVSFGQFIQIKEQFDLDPDFLDDYREMYARSIDKLEGEFSEPQTNYSALVAEMDAIKDAKTASGDDALYVGEANIGDAVQPVTMQSDDTFKMR